VSLGKSKLALAAKNAAHALTFAVLVILTATSGIVAGAATDTEGGAGAQPATLPAYQEALLPASTLAGVEAGPGGLLYGVTYEGGDNNRGTIFSAPTDLSSATVLHSFDGTDGRIPYGELTWGGAVLYGTTSLGGPLGAGTVFSFNPATGSLRTLAAFGFGLGRPTRKLLLLGDYLYGSTTDFPSGSTVFRVRTDGTEPVQFLHVFASTDGYVPGTLTEGPAGYLYGTAEYGGLAGCYPSPYDGCGTVWRMRPDGSDFAVIYRFDSSTIRGRGFPLRKLVVSSDGRLYGTTYKGVFSLAPDPAASDFQVLYTVPPAQGSQIFAPPIEGLDGRLYINQYDGGDGLTNGVGSVYSMTKAGTNVVTHHLFTLSSGGQGPYGLMHQDSAGTIYGTTEYNAASPQAPYSGTLFAIRGFNQGPIAAATAPATVAAGAGCLASVALDGSTSSDPNGDSLTYEWTEGGAVIATDATATVSLGIGAHTITLKVTDPSGANDSISVTVTVTSDVTLTYLGPSLLQGAGSNVLQALATTAGGPLAGAQLSFAVNGSLHSATADATGLASVDVGAVAGVSATVEISTIAGACGTATGTVNVPVNRWPTASGAASSPNVADQSCTAPVTLDASTSFDLDGDALTYVWAEGATMLSTQKAPTVTLTAGSHQITLTVSDGRGGSASTIVTATVVGQPVALQYTGPLQLTVGAPTPVTALLRTNVGVPIAGATIQFTIDGIVSAGTTDVAGVATASVTAPVVGSRTILVSYNGDACHQDTTIAASVDVMASAARPPVANSQSVTTAEDTAVVITLTGSDPNSDPITFQIGSQPPNGALSGSAPNVVYTPKANYNGPDNFTFKVNDGTADSNIATVSITVTPLNDAPVAVDDSYENPEDTSMSVAGIASVLRNDRDVDGDPLTVILVTPPAGTLIIRADGAFDYTPRPNFSGIDTFTYRVADGSLTSNVATVSIVVTPVNDAPLAANDFYSTPQDAPLTLAAPGVLANDSDVEGTPLTATWASGPSNGTLTLNSDGSFTYIPEAGFTGAVPFDYRTSDGAASTSARVVITVVSNAEIRWRPTGTLGSRRRSHTATLLTNGNVLVAGGYGQGNGSLDSAEIYDPATGTWSGTGKLVTRRAFHSATLLPNGQVLVAGGESPGQLNSAEIYDPGTGAWTVTGSLSVAHSRHTATLMPALGRVLLVGGYDSTPSARIAELYDPTTRTWSPTGSLSVGRNFHTATLLPNGFVLVAGGYGTNGGVNSAELYRPATGTWFFTGPMLWNRTGHTATLLPDGNVLVAGGGNNAGTLAASELYYSSTGAWVPMGNLNTARIQHTATLFDGKVLVAGGSTPAANSLASAELFDPATGQWSLTASLIAARIGHTATLLPNGKVLAVGGFGGGSTFSSTEIYGSAAQTSVGAWSPAASLLDRRLSHVATRLADGRVLVAGGSSAYLAGHLASAEIFDPVTGKWTTTGSLTVPRSSPVAVLLPTGKVLVAGGSNLAGVLRSAELYDPATGTWSPTGSLITGRTDATATLLTDGRVLVAGGHGGGAALASAEIYNPSTESWFPTGSLPAARYFASATLLLNGRVLLSGGADFQVGALNSTAIYNPATGAWTKADNLKTRRLVHTSTLLPDGRVLVTGGFGALNGAELFDPVSGKWRPAADLATGRGDHRVTLLKDGTVLVTGGVGQTLDLSETEVYSPTDDGWTPRGSLATPRSSHTATLLLDGKVLVVGGSSSGVAVASAEMYTP
jgi:uncharacterized repeat protein (TIGR03803 family)